MQWALSPRPGSQVSGLVGTTLPSRSLLVRIQTGSPTRSWRHQSMLSPHRFTSIRHQATAITTLGLTTGAIPRCRSISDSGAVIMAATTGEAFTAAASTMAVAGTDNRPSGRLGVAASFWPPQKQVAQVNSGRLCPVPASGRDERRGPDSHPVVSKNSCIPITTHVSHCNKASSTEPWVGAHRQWPFSL
jgi:hypothetical protein